MNREGSKSPFSSFRSFKPMKRLLTMAFAPLQVSTMLNKLHGQPESYDKKHVTKHPILLSETNTPSAEPNIGSVEHSVLEHMVSSERPMDQLARSP